MEVRTRCAAARSLGLETATPPTSAGYRTTVIAETEGARKSSIGSAQAAAQVEDDGWERAPAEAGESGARGWMEAAN